MKTNFSLDHLPPAVLNSRKLCDLRSFEGELVFTQFPNTYRNNILNFPSIQQLSLVRTNPFCKYHTTILTFKGNFNFHIIFFSNADLYNILHIAQEIVSKCDSCANSGLIQIHFLAS
jgi:hypothetical protein